MMGKQAELKQRAYASNLKSRALSVLIYLIDRSDKKLTCFPSIPTMAGQLHISISTVKRALHELEDAGFIQREARYRTKNRGQTSNLYTLIITEKNPPDEKDASPITFSCELDSETQVSDYPDDYMTPYEALEDNSGQTLIKQDYEKAVGTFVSNSFFNLWTGEEAIFIPP